MHGERLYSLTGLCRGGRIAPQAIPASRGYAGEARAGGSAAAPAARTGTLCKRRQSALQKVIAKSAVPCYDKGQKHLN